MGKAEDSHRDARPGLAMSPQAEASKMLEAALQQMDGIISGKKKIEIAWFCNNLKKFIDALKRFKYWVLIGPWNLSEFVCFLSESLRSSIF